LKNRGSSLARWHPGPVQSIRSLFPKCQFGLERSPLRRGRRNQIQTSQSSSLNQLLQAAALGVEQGSVPLDGKLAQEPADINFSFNRCQKAQFLTAITSFSPHGNKIFCGACRTIHRNHKGGLLQHLATTAPSSSIGPYMKRVAEGGKPVPKASIEHFFQARGERVRAWILRYTTSEARSQRHLLTPTSLSTN
jgi:hypothetical protein